MVESTSSSIVEGFSHRSRFQIRDLMAMVALVAILLAITTQVSVELGLLLSFWFFPAWLMASAWDNHLRRTYGPKPGSIARPWVFLSRVGWAVFFMVFFPFALMVLAFFIALFGTLVVSIFTGKIG
jgi:hypothetical protein